MRDKRRLKTAFRTALVFCLFLWLLKLVELALGIDLASAGIYPRSFEGLAGVLFAPLIHGSAQHLFANTGPLIVLLTALLYGYPQSAKLVLPVLYLGTGLGVWWFARESYHIGASGLTFGMMFYIFTIGIVRWDPRAMALSMLVFFLYGGMIWGIFPGDPSISHETHFFAMVLGIGLALLLRHRDPPPPRKRYSWEDETEVPSTGESNEDADGLDRTP